MDVKKELQDLCDRYKAEAEAILAKAKKAEKKAWKPEKEEYCCYITDSGHVEGSTWSNILDWRESYAIGNCFPTKEAAEFAVEKLKVIAELKRFAEEHNEEIDWKAPMQQKVNLAYSHEFNRIEHNILGSWQSNDIYFSSVEIANAAIEAIGEERLKKYYFEVEE